MLFPILFLLSFALLARSCKSDKVSPVETKVKAIDSITAFQSELYKNRLDSLFKKTPFNGMVSIQKGDQLLYERFVGLEDFEKKTKLDSASVFAIASLSKQFTAALILQLVDQKKLAVQDSVSKFLPDFRTPELKFITIHQLLTHTSGLNDYANHLSFKPGAHYLYSNKGYNTLGQIIETVGQSPYEAQLQTLFNKAGMPNSFAASNFKETFASAHTGTLPNPSKVPNMPLRLAKPEIGLAAGGLLSTARDLHRWNQSLYGGEILSGNSLQALTKPSVDTENYILGKVHYGYGLMSSKYPPKSFYHTGYVKGSASLLIYYPTSKTSVVILCNSVNERLGKKQIFAVHQQVKEFTELVEHSLNGILLKRTKVEIK